MENPLGESTAAAGAGNDTGGSKKASGIADRARQTFASVFGSLTALSGSTRLIVWAVGTIVGAIILLWLVDKIVLYFIARSYVDAIAIAYDLNPHLADALVLLTFMTAFFFVSNVWSFSKRKRLTGIVGLSGLLVLHSLALWQATRNTPVDAHGNALQCYVLSRNGTVTYGHNRGIDPATGRECLPVKPELVERLKAYGAGQRPRQVTDLNPVFFDPRSSEPIVWYYQSKDGNIEIFDLMGFHPDTGEELLPITKEIAEAWRKQVARRAPKLISDPEKYVFFDPLSGKARAWFWVSSDNRYEFYDAPGFQPQTGDKLEIITQDVLNRWHDLTSAPTPQCYVLSRNGTVTYGHNSGIDPATGRECRPATPELVERLEAYKSGKRPQKITNLNPVFFDPRSSEPIVWYYQSKDGSIEIFDLMGFYPDTGEELLPITKEIAQRFHIQVTQRVPKLISDPEKYVFFDLLDGKPRAWYWHDPNGCYEFYDSQGFQPQTGEQLLIVSPDVVAAWKKCIEKTSGSAPNLVDPHKYPPFSPVTGAAQVWYWRGKNGAYEFYDGPGFQPQTGEELLLVTPDVVKNWEDGLKLSVPSPSPGPSTSSPGDEQKLRQSTVKFLQNLYASVSGSDNDALAEASYNYADPVNYFGKSYTHDQVMVELQNFRARWPMRRYTVRPDTVQISCNVQSLTCVVQGLLDFDSRSPERNQRSWGSATFGYTLTFATLSAAPKIVREEGDVQARHLEPYAYPTAPPFSYRPSPPVNGGAIVGGIIGGILNQMVH